MAATFTPMLPDGRLNLGQIGPMTEALLARGVQGLYVCGSTGEGLSLSSQERMAVAAEYVQAAAKRVPVIVQVGHDSLTEARALAEHAAQVGADAVSAIPPSYFVPQDLTTIVACAKEVADAAPGLEFFYYHIPAMTGVTPDITELVDRCLSEIPTFAGVKFSDTRVYELSTCATRHGDDVTLLFGSDEMLLSGLVAGAHGAVGSTYNFLTEDALAVIDAHREGDIGRAQEAQLRLTERITLVVRLGGLPALKSAMSASGVECGPPRLPLRAVTEVVADQLRTMMSTSHAPAVANVRRRHAV